MHHDKPETKYKTPNPLHKLHSNEFEAQMVAALILHLVRQGQYPPTEIAVLTPYLGQLHSLWKSLHGRLKIEMNKRDLDDLRLLHFEIGSSGAQFPSSTPAHDSDDDSDQEQTAPPRGIRAVTVDHYRGGEASVVIVSLVRSNPEQIALLSPRGVCQRPCDRKLPCDHACPEPCYSNALHYAVKCREPSDPSQAGCEHAGQRACGATREAQCNVQVEGLDIYLPCGHVVSRTTC